MSNNKDMSRIVNARWLLVCVVLFAMLSGCTATKLPIGESVENAVDYDALDTHTVLEMPDRVELPCDGAVLTIVPFNDNTLVYSFGSETELVRFTREQILELNELYCGIADFSDASNVDEIKTYIYDNGDCYTVSWAFTQDEQLQAFLDRLYDYYYEGAAYPEREVN